MTQIAVKLPSCTLTQGIKRLPADPCKGRTHTSKVGITFACTHTLVAHVRCPCSSLGLNTRLWSMEKNWIPDDPSIWNRDQGRGWCDDLSLGFAALETRVGFRGERRQRGKANRKMQLGQECPSGTGCSIQRPCTPKKPCGPEQALPGLWDGAGVAGVVELGW